MLSLSSWCHYLLVPSLCWCTCRVNYNSRMMNWNNVRPCAWLVGHSLTWPICLYSYNQTWLWLLLVWRLWLLKRVRFMHSATRGLTTGHYVRATYWMIGHWHALIGKGPVADRYNLLCTCTCTMYISPNTFYSHTYGFYHVQGVQSVDACQFGQWVRHVGHVS